MQEGEEDAELIHLIEELRAADPDGQMAGFLAALGRRNPGLGVQKAHASSHSKSSTPVSPSDVSALLEHERKLKIDELTRSRRCADRHSSLLSDIMSTNVHHLGKPTNDVASVSERVLAFLDSHRYFF